ncbi:ComEC/Rec2 family competence protein [Phenylobacterium immobile]|uniref:ComEC/Rec2 family competence protein n=1 Tax=Phenylobacterium immobile TaxID=21 RepID=UPI000A8D9B35|nr:ComEC/Rec2 family competence protein [Phenylobacterium immobile]
MTAELLQTPEVAPALTDRGLLTWFRRELSRQAPRWPLWSPVALGLGAASYFALPGEPQSLLAVALGLTGLGLLVAGRFAAHRWAVAILTLVACGLIGFAVAKARTERVATPIASADTPPVRVIGWVVDVGSPGQGGQRLLVAPIAIEGVPADNTPGRIRVTLRAGTAVPPPGEAIDLLAKIGPPPPPAAPGSYDFARDAYFESIGGVGFALGAPQGVRPTNSAPTRLRLTMQVNRLRWNLAVRIVELLGPETGGLAAAMTSGVEAFVPREQVDALRAAGLAHIISISGLHMAIVGGFAFAGVRLAVAAWPWLTLRAPGKKIAAVFGLAAVGGYLAISGASPPAERAAITAAVAFVAILVDRQAISLRALAMAAIVIILLQPEAVTEPGFQMSFAATAALVALAEAWPRPIREISVPFVIRALQAARTWIFAGGAISLVAGLATGPFAVQHFNRVAVWGLAANLLVEPISTLLIMPGLAIGAILTPFELGEAPLRAAGFGISLMTQVATQIANAPMAQMTVASAPAWTLPAAFLGILWICLTRGPIRWLGLPLALSVNLAPRPAAPVAWISADGAAVAVRADQTAVLMRPDVKRFGAELWARRRGLEPTLTEAERNGFFQCDAWSCGPTAHAPLKIAATWNVSRPLKTGRLEALCADADILVLRAGRAPGRCVGPLILTQADFARGGSAEIFRTEKGAWRLAWSQDLRGHRPWTWGYGGEGAG